VSDIDIAVVDSLKALDPNGRLEKRTWLGAVRAVRDAWPRPSAMRSPNLGARQNREQPRIVVNDKSAPSCASLSRINQIAMRTPGTTTVCGFPKLETKHFFESFCLPVCTIALDNVSSTRPSMAFCGIIPNADRHIGVERTYCHGAGSL
jgi:hypothetical protein